MKSHLNLCLASLILIVTSLCGCAPTTQLYNEASVRYHKNGIFSDPSLDQNKIADILFLVSTGYIQVRNKNQLSIYITCVTNTPKSINTLSGELVTSNEIKAIAYSSTINCNNGDPYVYTKEEGYLYGSGYFHFMGTDLQELIQQPNLGLKFSFEYENKKYFLRLPVKSKVVWVWPT